MIGGDDHQIAFVHRGLDLRPARIEMFQRAGITFRVTTMTVEHVKVYEVRKDQATILVAQSANRLIDRLFVVLCG